MKQKSKPIDDDLSKAIKAGNKAKSAAERKKTKEADDARKKHKEYIKSQIPEAKKWIKDVLMKKITEETAKGCSRISLGDRHGHPGISAEAIYEAAKMIDGLKPGTVDHNEYDSDGYLRSWATAYYVEW